MGSYTSGYSTPYFTGSGTTAGAGTAYPASLGAVAYELDTKGYEFSQSSVPLLRAATDDKENVGHQTLNPEAFWRRTFESWHVGAGQTHFDRVDDSNPWRFRRSKNIDVWDRHQLSLLNATADKATLTSGTGMLAVAGSYLYAVDDTDPTYTQDITAGTPSWTTVTGGPVTAATAIASDGYTVLTAHGTDGIYKTTRGAATTASQLTGTASEVAYGKGRWIAAEGPDLYDITTEITAAAGALPTAHFTHPNSDFAWNCFAEGPTALYAAGYSGDKSLIYQLTIKSDGTGLNQPVVAGFLPDGEIAHSMKGYLGLVLIGTNRGVRVAAVGADGELTIGAFIPTDDTVQCFEGQGTYVWFGWSDFESEDAGLGRLNLETFSDVDALAPAYASDIMSGTTGDVVSVVTFQDVRVFTVDTGANAVVYAEEDGTLAETGQLDSGVFDYALTDPKLSLYVDVSHIHDGGSHSLYLSVDRATFAHLATRTSQTHAVATGEARGNEFELRVVLTRDSTDTSLGPTIRSMAVRAQPATEMTEYVTIPLLIGPTVTRRDGVVVHVDSLGQRDNIRTLARTKQVALFTLGDEALSVIVSDFQFDIRDVWVGADAPKGIAGTCLTRLKVVT